MRKIFTIVAFISLAMVFGCSENSSSSSKLKDLENEFRIGNRYPCLLNLLTESLFEDEIYVYLDGGNSIPDFETGKWSGNGPRMMFVFERPSLSSTNIPIGTLTLGQAIKDIQVCENYNNDGEVFTPILNFKDGILNSAKSGQNYIFSFTGVDQNDSVVMMKFKGPVGYIFDWANEH